MPEGALEAALSEYIVGPRPDDVPPAVRERARLHILDTLGAMLSGRSLKPGRLAVAITRTQGGTPESSVVGSDLRTSAGQAALANGMAAHADETDDSHFATVSHPGSVVVPAALAVSERQHRSGRDFVTAVVLGYDVMCRMVKALQREEMSQRGLHAASIAGGFGSAAAASRLLGLDAEQARNALALTGTQASGLTTWRQDREHVDKSLCFAGVPSRNGVTAALWAEAGFTATPTVFSAYCDHPQPDELLAELGERYEILDTSIKKYPAGQPMQATLEGFFTLLRGHRLRGQDISQVTVRLPERQAHTVNDRKMPDVNCQYLLAVAMLDGDIDFASAHDFERMQASDVLALKPRVKLLADEELTRGFPAIRAAIVELTMNDGRTFQTRVDRLPGAPYNPLSAEEVAAKFTGLSAALLGEAGTRAVIEAVERIDALDDVFELGALLRVPAERSVSA
jgi:2-methylcitrate dehydratase PrpD